MSEYLSTAAVVIGALRVKKASFHSMHDALGHVSIWIKKQTDGQMIETQSG